MRKYSQEHEWVVVEGDEATVGISKYAAGELGDITFVEQPEVGTEVAAGDVLGTVESVKAASDFYSPVAGKVTSINEKLEDSPETVNESAEGEGWICKLGDIDASGLDSLMDEAAYEAFIKGS